MSNASKSVRIPEFKVNASSKDIERFHKYVNKVESGCWEWTGNMHRTGYGKFWFEENGGTILAHRFSLALHKGPIPEGMCACHHCDNKKCVNPDHLYAGTYKQNTKDSIDRGLTQTGDRHWSKRMPERIQKGDDHWTFRNPEKILRGLASFPAMHPERMARGERNSHAILTTQIVEGIMTRFMSGEKATSISRSTGINYNTIHSILTGKNWKHVNAAGFREMIEAKARRTNTDHHQDHM